jgi:hypothetical protein
VDRDQWRASVNTTMNLQAQQQAVSFLTRKGTVSYSRAEVYGRGYSDQKETCMLQAKIQTIESRRTLVMGSTFDVKKLKTHGMSPRANYTDLANADCRRS